MKNEVKRQSDLRKTQGIRTFFTLEISGEWCVRAVSKSSGASFGSLLKHSNVMVHFYANIQISICAL